MTDLPTRVPFGMCLPKECNSTANFDETLNKIQVAWNQFFDSQKKTIDFNRLWESKKILDLLYVHSAEQDMVATKNIMMIMSERTHFGFQPRVMNENRTVK